MSVSAQNSRMRNYNKTGWMSGLRRLVRLRLVIPVMRAKHPPEYTARGVLVGVAVAMTPTVGVQMPIVAVIWLLARLFRPGLSFNPLLAMAWTWVTNVFTLAPFYYLFLVTGELMRGRFGESATYEAFSAHLALVLGADVTWYQALWVYLIELFRAWGVPMFLGCVPWAIVSAWVGYRWSLRLSHSLVVRRQKRHGRLRSHTSTEQV